MKVKQVDDEDVTLSQVFEQSCAVNGKRIQM